MCFIKKLQDLRAGGLGLALGPLSSSRLFFVFILSRLIVPQKISNSATKGSSKKFKKRGGGGSGP